MPVHKQRLSDSQDTQGEQPSRAENDLSATGLPRYRQIYDDLHADLRSGRFKAGDRLPSEAELGKRYNVSRITIAKAVNELQLQGLVSRRAGSGTHVLPLSQASGHIFGLLIPDLGRTEIFEPICHGMMQSPLSRSHSLLWGHSMGEGAEQEQQAEQLAQQFIGQHVSGVFFAPLEFTPDKDQVNWRIAQALEKAHIPIVLLDRCYAKAFQRTPHDLVGINNHRAAYQLTEHLIRNGSKRIAFFARRRSASTVMERIQGYRDALHAHGLRSADLLRRGDPHDSDFVDELMTTGNPDAIVCANDLTAAYLMSTLTSLGVPVPDRVRIVGIDDVKYASLLPVPLTTQHQNCADIGSVAFATMLQRLQSPNLPVRDVLLQTHTVVRRSCGAHLNGNVH